MKIGALSLFLTASVILVADIAAAAPQVARNSSQVPVEGRTPLADGLVGVGLAPTTWGFVSSYSGSLYGTGYYPFRVDLTYAGSNSIYGYDFQYSSVGFVNEIRAIYAFDVSSLSAAANGAPIWSAFMFDTRERPADGTAGLSAFAQMRLESTGGTHTLFGLSLFQNYGGAANLDIYDAEDFENAAPFDNPELAFIGTNPLIGTAPIAEGVVVPINFDVTDAVNADLGGGSPSPLEIPTAGTVGLIGLALLLAAVGALLLRR